MLIEIKRIERLVNSAIKKDIPSIRSDEGDLLWYRGWLEYRDASSNIVRRAQAKAFLHSHSTPIIGDGELIAGKPCYRVLSPSEQQELDDFRGLYGKMLPVLGGQASHMAVDYEKLLKLGFDGIKEQVKVLKDGICLEDPGQIEKDEFYEACLAALNGVIAYAANYSQHARTLAESCLDEARKSELLEISRVLSKVPTGPSESFREALQSVHFLTFCMEGLYQPGRPDRYLIEYYRQDIENGVLTQEAAQELIDCFCVLFNEYVPKGLAVGFMVGGRDAEGNDVSNELTALFIESIAHTRMIYPGIGVCYTLNTPAFLLERSCKILAEGFSHPALFNDEVITRGLRSYGLTASEACLYVQSTCVEITPAACSAVWVASPYINLPQLLLDILGIGPLDQDGREPVTVCEFSGFEAFKAEFRKRLNQKIRKEAIEQNRLQMNRTLHGGDSLVSCFVNDCLTCGKDVDQGGARYNWIMPSFVGLSNLADSFVAIRRLVFEGKKLSFTALSDALLSDFSCCGELRWEIANRIPKYGNDNDEADSMVREISLWIAEETGKFRTYRGDRFIPSLFCWIMHEHMGSRTAATPDGRRSAFPLGDGSGPAQGREKKGPTASILSSTKWSHDPFIGGIAINIKFSKSLLGPQSTGMLTSLVKTFMERGGFELQVNVVDRAMLLKARERPEEYHDLVVRVGGYSDYFTHLSPAMQEEIIQRTEHNI